MGIDIKRVAASALQAALQEATEQAHRANGKQAHRANGEQAHRPRDEHPQLLRGAGTVAAGAALVTAARVGQKHLPRLRKLRLLGHGLAKLDDVPNVQNFTDSLRDKFAGGGHRDDSSESEGSQSQGNEGEDYEEDAGEPADWLSDLGGEDASSGDENGDEASNPTAGGGENDAPEDGRGDTPDLVAALSAPQSGAPVMERMAGRLDPAARAPKAAERRADGRRPRSRRGAGSGSRRKTKSTEG